MLSFKKTKRSFQVLCVRRLFETQLVYKKGEGLSTFKKQNLFGTRGI